MSLGEPGRPRRPASPAPPSSTQTRGFPTAELAVPRSDSVQHRRACRPRALQPGHREDGGAVLAWRREPPLARTVWERPDATQARGPRSWWPHPGPAAGPPAGPPPLKVSKKVTHVEQITQNSCLLGEGELQPSAWQRGPGRPRRSGVPRSRRARNY